MRFSRSVTFWLTVITAAVFLLQLQAIEPLALSPVEFPAGAYWQLFTYMFLHADVVHIAFNMFTFLIFGFPLERAIGRGPFLFLYLAAGLVSGLFFLLIEATTVPLVGASGAVFGVMTAYAVMYPKSWLFTPLGPLPTLPAIILILGFELVAGVLRFDPRIANFGHIGGIITGFVFILYWTRLRKQSHADRVDDDGEPLNNDFYWE